jgi:nicotinamidase/pyrazinamidase
MDSTRYIQYAESGLRVYFPLFHERHVDSMTLPEFYKPDTARTLHQPDLQGAYQAGIAHYQRNPKRASEDQQRVLLWLIDVQIDFVFPAPVGNLPVPGALDDTQRTIEWLYRNIDQVTHIAASLDTHTAFQIFHPAWWRDAQGNPPPPFTVITAEDVAAGRWLPGLDADWSRAYVRELEQVGRKQLMIWPYHCMEGTAGRALVPALSEAIQFHSGARDTQATFLVKGTIPQTEFYSVIEPEVKYPQHPEGGVNTRFLESLSYYDLIYVAGQARSHCVLETMNSVVRHTPELLGRVRFLNDCTSSIAGFEESTEKRIAEFAAQGVRLVNAADAIL